MAKSKAVPKGPDYKFKEYLYNGPRSGATLRLGPYKAIEVDLIDGRTVKLPEGHPQVAAMIANGRLTEPPKEAAQDQAEETPPTDPKEKGGK